MCVTDTVDFVLFHLLVPTGRLQTDHEALRRAPDQEEGERSKGDARTVRRPDRTRARVVVLLLWVYCLFSVPPESDRERKRSKHMSERNERRNGRRTSRYVGPRSSGFV